MTCGVIMPVLISDENSGIKYLQESIESVVRQEEKNWKLYVIDDASNSILAKRYLEEMQSLYPEQIYLTFNSVNRGPGACRNIGIQMASKECEFIFFLDADDIAHPSRLLECVYAFKENPVVDVVYSTFEIIDEESNIINREGLSPSIVSILQSHDVGPPVGINAWIKIGTKSGYTNLTSATAVRSELALKYPFPNERISEDMHTWLRYSAGGGEFYFISRPLTQYRIPISTCGSASRSREGGKYNFYKEKCRVDEDGFRECIEIGINRCLIELGDKAKLMSNFHLHLAECMQKEGFNDLADIQVKRAKYWLY
jgi:glycosyltransferase involved in cell wall biosynthesis